MKPFAIGAVALWTAAASAAYADTGSICGTVRLPRDWAGAYPSLIRIRKAEAPAGGFPKRAVSVDQRGFQFVPRVTAVTAGGSAVFLNNDKDAHNVRSLAGPVTFNIVVPPGGKETVELGKEGTVVIGCNIHNSMKSYVHVVQNPYFAIVGGAGSFEIRDVPPGVYELEMWNEFLEPVVQSVRVRPGRVTSADFRPKLPPQVEALFEDEPAKK